MVIIQCTFFIFICILAIWQNLLLIITSLDLNVSDVKMRLLLSVRVGNFLHASQSNFLFVWSCWIVTKHIHFYIIGWRFPLLVTFSPNTTSWNIPYQCFKTALNFFIFFLVFLDLPILSTYFRWQSFCKNSIGKTWVHWL